MAGACLSDNVYVDFLTFKCHCVFSLFSVSTNKALPSVSQKGTQSSEMMRWEYDSPQEREKLYHHHLLLHKLSLDSLKPLSLLERVL